MTDLELDIELLKKLFEDNINVLTAEEQNRLVNLIQKLVFKRDMNNRRKEKKQ